MVKTFIPKVKSFFDVSLLAWVELGINSKDFRLKATSLCDGLPKLTGAYKGCGRWLADTK